MSQINDALKRLQKISAEESSGSLPSLPPPPNPSPSVMVTLIPAIVIILVVAAVFFIGWAMVHQPAQNIAAAPVAASVAAPKPVVAAQPAEATPVPIAASAPVTPPPVAPALPKLQGIFYSSKASSAIVDGQMVRPGDAFKKYQVKEITRLTVILTDAEGQTIKLVMDH